ncbi:hypothetical protein DBT_1732 [Dissulfuribacter thermophilus]|uniref:Uncharacterized protein n=1 Tax=Dissulfuribacter thermophilus TaxID=1156395 RepID=A0A1B9F4R5_9BACT|nr:hypothetical protein DBT_1732 [Dissulfuribacter thermophilus]
MCLTGLHLILGQGSFFSNDFFNEAEKHQDTRRRRTDRFSLLWKLGDLGLRRQNLYIKI